jgi:hypothetical protein
MTYLKVICSPRVRYRFVTNRAYFQSILLVAKTIGFKDRTQKAFLQNWNTKRTRRFGQDVAIIGVLVFQILQKTLDFKMNSYFALEEFWKNSYVHYFNIESEKNQELSDGYKEYRFKKY